MRLVVFGASGATGRDVVSQALSKEHTVTAFVRDPARLAIQHPSLRLVQGNVVDDRAVASAIAGQDAVICTLGVGKPLKSDPDVIDGVRNILRAMEESDVRRLIYVSFAGDTGSRAWAGGLFRTIVPKILRNEIADHAVKEGLITQSPIDWIIVRPPKLTGLRRTGSYRSGEGISSPSILPLLSRADLAEFLIAQLDDPTNVRKAVSVLH